MNIPDNTKFENMVKNRPPVSILPAINKRLISQRILRMGFTFSAVALLGSIYLYKFWLNANSSPFIKTRKTFRFDADPYSGKIRCNFNDVPNYQHGY
jgi:hypothetical protein